MKQPKPKKVSGGKTTQIKAATKEKLKAGTEFTKYGIQIGGLGTKDHYEIADRMTKLRRDIDSYANG